MRLPSIVRRSGGDLDETAKGLSQYPGECILLASDLSSTVGINRLAEELADREGALHILVNNAGSQSQAPFEEFTEGDWDTVLDLNLKAVFFVTQQLLPLLRFGASADRRASVINTSSITAKKTGARNDYSYRASKAGLNQLTRMLGKDLAGDNINVNAISPGFFKSNVTSFMFENDALYQRFMTANPVPREGRPEEIAGLAIYLASRAGNYMTGAIIDIDGGLSLND